MRCFIGTGKYTSTAVAFGEMAWKAAVIEPRNEKPVFGVCDQGRLKLACAAIEASWRLAISDIETRDIILSRQRTKRR